MARSAVQLETLGATLRVSTASIQVSLEAIRNQLGMDYSHALYRYISRRTGIHPTTLLRYDLGKLETAPYALSSFLARLRHKIARGFRPAIEGRLQRPAPAAKKKVPNGRIRNARVRRLLLGLIERLQVPANMFFRQVGTAVGLHPITVLRHAEGRLATAPWRLFEYLSDMEQALDAGQEVVFTRAKVGTRIVPRQFVVQEVQRLMDMRVFPSKRSLLRFVAASLQMKPRSLERAYSARKQVLLPEEVLRFVRGLRARLEYVPEARYEVGDRIFHPDFGAGVVVGKEPKDRVVVALADGRQRVFRERLIEMREWDRREDWWDSSDSIGRGGT